MVFLVKKLNQNMVFKFLSSVRLAVPLMMIITAVVAYGTVVESRYNSEMAKLVVYNTKWFMALMVLLWINIFCATLSRYPFKKHHVGFVTVHLGLLTLLIGGLITGFEGIDGQLRLAINESDSTVYLPDLVLGYKFQDSPGQQIIPVTRDLNEKSFSPDDRINQNIKHLFTINKYLPFAELSQAYKTGSENKNDLALGFILRSQFFNVSEWLHTRQKSELQMGPAKLKIINDNDLSTRRPSNHKQKNKANIKEGTLLVSDENGQEVKKTGISQLRKSPLKLNDGTLITIKNVFNRAIVSDNKIVEGDPGQTLNPALEVSIVYKDKNFREVLYEKFPNFSLKTDQSFPYKLKYLFPQGEEVNNGTPETQEGGNVVEFHVTPGANSVNVILFKDSQQVGQSTLTEGQSYQTPWMGMNIILGTIINGAEEVQEVKKVEPELRQQQLPSSALEIGFPQSDESLWLTEGQSVRVQLLGRPAEIFFTRKTLQLPFEMKLLNFSKLDYPGTETAMSFESTVDIGKSGESVLISMNNPLKKSGYTVYQSSYILNPGQPPVSIFSINHDPGRAIKYAGSLILCIGIIIFTLMRSQWWRRRYP